MMLASRDALHAGDRLDVWWGERRHAGVWTARSADASASAVLWSRAAPAPGPYSGSPAFRMPSSSLARCSGRRSGTMSF